MSIGKLRPEEGNRAQNSVSYLLLPGLFARLFSLATTMDTMGHLARLRELLPPEDGSST